MGEKTSLAHDDGSGPPGVPFRSELEPDDVGGLGTLLPIAERPFILGARAAMAVWAAALNVSRSLYS